MVDVISIKKAVENNELQFYVKNGDVLCRADNGDCVKVGKEMERRGATGIPLGVKQTDLDKWCEEQKGNTVATIAIMAATVLFDEFEMTPEEIDRFWRRFTSKTESLMQRFVNWRELQEVLQDEAGLNFELPEVFTKEIGQ